MRTGQCPKHGKIEATFHVFATSDPDYSTGRICPKCFVDFIRANVPVLTDIRKKDGTPV